MYSLNYMIFTLNKLSPLYHSCLAFAQNNEITMLYDGNCNQIALLNDAFNNAIAKVSSKNVGINKRYKNINEIPINTKISLWYFDRRILREQAKLSLSYDTIIINHHITHPKWYKLSIQDTPLTTEWYNLSIREWIGALPPLYTRSYIKMNKYNLTLSASDKKSLLTIDDILFTGRALRPHPDTYGIQYKIILDTYDTLVLEQF